MKRNSTNTPSTYLRRSISRKLIVYIILFSLVVTLLSTTFQIYLEFRRDVNVIKNTISDIETSHLPNIVNNLWLLNQELLETQLKGISNLPDIQYLELQIENETSITSGVYQAENTIKKSFDLIYYNKRGKNRLGTLDVYADLNRAYQLIWNRALITFGTQAIIFSFLSAFIIGLFYFTIGRYLLIMSEYTRGLGYNTLNKPLVLKGKTKNRYIDELNQLEIAINEMRENLASDILKRETIERQLRESENKHRTLLDNIPQKIFYKDSQSVYITCNNNYAMDFNITKEEIEGKTDYDFYPKELAEKYRWDDQAVISGGVTKELEESYICDKKEFIVQTVKTPIYNADGENIGLLGIFWDITHKKKNQLELQNAKDELEIRVAERTARLQETNKRLEEEIAIHKQTEKKLTFAKQDAERANQAKSEFLSNISHELRTPMHHILNYSRFGLEKHEQVPLEKLIHYFSQIRKTGNRLMILLNDLLDLSKLESGRADYKIKNHDILRILNDAISEIGSLAKEKDVQLKSDSEQPKITVNCDAYKMGQVFRNLLSNAIKYSPVGEIIQISLKLRDMTSSEKKINYLKVSISDQGVGIPENEFESIFDKFTQSSKTKTGAGGSGLGLAICKEIIEGHKGRIWVKNNSSGGATFFFTLPLENQTEYHKKNQPDALSV